MIEIIEIKDIIEAIKDEEINEEEEKIVKRYMQARGMLKSIGIPKILIGTEESMKLFLRVLEIKNNDGGEGKTPEEWLEIQKKTMS